MTSREDLDPRVVRILETFGESAAILGLTWEETEAMWERVVEQGHALKDTGCTCKLRLILDFPARDFIFDHYDDCAIGS